MVGFTNGSLDLPLGANLGTTVFSTEGEVPQAVAAQSSCEVAAARPLTPTDTMPSVMALGLNDQLSALESQMVVDQQKGFVRGRQLADYVYEVESAMLSFFGDPVPERGRHVLRLLERLPCC